MTWSVDSETGTLRDVLLCPPDHYHWIPTNAVAHQTLQSDAVFDSQLAHRQFREFVDALEGAGVTCHYLEPEPQLAYQVYTRDSSQTTPWGPLITQLAMPQRRGEVAGVLNFYGRHGGYWRVASSGAIEGGDIHLIRPGLAAIGWSGIRTAEDGAEQFAAWFRDHGWEVRLVPFAEHFLHLDVLFCMITDRLAIACVEVLGDDFAAWLAGHGIAVVPATYREVMEMSCNVLALGQDRVISPHHSRRVNEAIRAHGVAVIDPELDHFALGGGCVHCMSMPLRRDPVS